METVLIAGATGALGSKVVTAARQRGLRVRALSRRQVSASELGADEVVTLDPLRDRDLSRAFVGVERVFSALGASVTPEFGRGFHSFPRVDTPANLALLEHAKSAGVKRFVYVSVAGHEEFAAFNYVSAHERVVSALRSSGLSYAVLRPTGFFSAFAALLGLAERGPVPLFGSPDALTNPVADEDLAELAVDALGDAPSFERSVGGPITYTRRAIAELAFSALGKSPEFRRLPSGLVRGLSWVFRPFNPRVADLLGFYLAASSRDCLGERTGESTLEEYFTAQALLRGRAHLLRS